MKIIAYVNQKGGSGKTTSAISMASYWFINGMKVAIVDADLQQSAIGWSKLRDKDSKLLGIDVYSLDNQADIQDIKGLDVDLVIIDTAGHDNPIKKAAIEAADAVILPIKPTSFDIAASSPTFQKIAAEGKPCVYLINQVISGTTMLEEAKEAFSDAALPHLENHIGNYVSYARSLGYGETPYSENRYSFAGIQLKKVCDEFMRVIKWR